MIPKILHPELHAIWLALANTQTTPHNIHIFTDNLNNICIINNHVWCPFSQHNHPDKLLIALIVHFIMWSQHKTTIHKAQAHMSVQDNKLACALANKGTFKSSITQVPHIHVTHTLHHKPQRHHLISRFLYTKEHTQLIIKHAQKFRFGKSTIK